MPWFRRCDGELVTKISDVQRIMPYIMRGRNESVVYHSMQAKIGKASAWIREYNRSRPRREYATLFHLGLYICARLLHERPGANRFVAGGRIYQRKGVWISFVAKKRLADDSPMVTIKLQFPENEPFEDCVKRINEAVIQALSDRKVRIDSELRLLLRLPGPLLRVIVAALHGLDRLNLLPAGFIEPDPMYTSLFAANLGLISGSNAFHHLYEYGTCSVFAVMGEVRKTVLVGRDGLPDVCDVLDVFWTFDERINDGFYVLKTLKTGLAIFEDPERWVYRRDTPKTSVADGLETMGQAVRPHA